MSKGKGRKQGHGKMLDAWVPPEEAGDPVGCVATSFTFSPVFFEEECLGRFLQIESSPTEDGPLYMVEREERLSGVSCAAALVDQHNCREPRNLRWDLLSARLPRGILHAKISLLHWSGLIRLVISSANLTDDGYRRNREVFGALDFRQGEPGATSCLREAVDFLRSAVEYSDTAHGGSPALHRWNSFLDGVLKSINEWGVKEFDPRKNPVNVHTLFIGPGRPDVFDVLRRVWPGVSPSKWAFVTSPFFDPPEAGNKPAKKLWETLSQRGEAEVTYNVVAEDEPGSNTLFIHAPESLKAATPKGRGGTETYFARVELEEGKDVRPLHLKSIWLENDPNALYMIGSSNFTSAGLGLSLTPNLEANLVYVVNKRKNEKAYRALDKSYLYGDDIDTKKYELKWSPPVEEGEDSPEAGVVLLPRAFGQATYHCEGGKEAWIELCISSTPPPDWKLWR